MDEVIIETDRLMLRPWKEADAEALYARRYPHRAFLQNDPRRLPTPALYPLITIMTGQMEILRCSATDYASLVEIWERSVRATHTFLSEKDIKDIRANLASQYFPGVDLYKLIVDGTAVAFMGLSDSKIEMLFVDSNGFGRGYGTLMIDFALKQGCTEVDVNEQNPSATGFYFSKGFKIVSRDSTDDAGRPFPILHMRHI